MQSQSETQANSRSPDLQQQIDAAKATYRKYWQDWYPHKKKFSINKLYSVLTSESQQKIEYGEGTFYKAIAEKEGPAQGARKQVLALLDQGLRQKGYIYKNGRYHKMMGIVRIFRNIFSQATNYLL